MSAPDLTTTERNYQDLRAAKELGDKAPLPAATWEPDGGYLLRSEQL